MTKIMPDYVKSTATFICEALVLAEDKRLANPGQYDGHLRDFGHSDKKMTIGGKYKWVPDSNPAPGQYDPEGAVGVTKPKSTAALIKEETGYQVPRENLPDPG